MTEHEWLTCCTPSPMLRSLRGKITENKIKLFVVGCFRRIWGLLKEEKELLRIIKLAEKSLDNPHDGDVQSQLDRKAFFWFREPCLDTAEWASTLTAESWSRAVYDRNYRRCFTEKDLVTAQRASASAVSIQDAASAKLARAINELEKAQYKLGLTRKSFDTARQSLYASEVSFQALSDTEEWRVRAQAAVVAARKTSFLSALEKLRFAKNTEETALRKLTRVQAEVNEAAFRAHQASGHFISIRGKRIEEALRLSSEAQERAMHNELAAQAVLLRDIVGKRIHSVQCLDPAILIWRDGTIRRLAQAINDERRMPAGTLNNSHLAILADALLDAGCDNEELIQHCRSAGPHVRGCWCVDLILAKE